MKENQVKYLRVPFFSDEKYLVIRLHTIMWVEQRDWSAHLSNPVWLLQLVHDMSSPAEISREPAHPSMPGSAQLYEFHILHASLFTTSDESERHSIFLIFA